MALILDTSPLYASLDRSDADHAACRRLIEETDEPLLIPAPVLAEVDYWVHVRLHPGVFVALLDDIIDGAYRVEDYFLTDVYGLLRQIVIAIRSRVTGHLLGVWPNSVHFLSLMAGVQAADSRPHYTLP